MTTTSWKTSLLIGLIVVLILALLQPFKLNEVLHHKYLIILGYGILSFLASLFYFFLAKYIFRINMESHTLAKFLVSNLFYIVLMGALVSSYASFVYTGSIRWGWFTGEGTFSLSAFKGNCIYVAIITFFVDIFLIFYENNKLLSRSLKEEIALNKVIANRDKEKKRDEHSATLHEITLTGSTKASVKMYVEDLMYVESEGNYVHLVFTQGEQTIKRTLRCTLKQMETALNEYTQIIKCHRAFLVNAERIIHVTGNTQGYRLTLLGTDNEIPVSRAYTSRVYQLIETLKP